jgi:hypothetical protein
MTAIAPSPYDNLSVADLDAIRARLERAPASDVTSDGRALLDEVRRLRLALAVVRERYEDLVQAVATAIGRQHPSDLDAPIGYGLTLRAIQTLSTEPR